ncbi:hypothetical protein [Paenibacillus lutrae]|uniref:WYL domain-containing protein n=1 Tax=Paenibacillus lutrae TaxID=2078573 RepID=A0A7X3FJJ8_9BACL|nr:hypothetical protein [Paenibacillus lutrae]MVP00866.1 hypothetical protein [Paenibacillus lutrae]
MSAMERYLGRKVSIIYMDRKGTISKRDVRPVNVHTDQIRAYCYARKAMRNFRKEDILAWTPCADSAASFGLPKVYPHLTRKRENYSFDSSISG